MAVIEGLRARDNLTRSEADLADFILRHADEVTQMSMRDLAAASYKSNRTIENLCRKAGSSGWRAFRTDFAADLERLRRTSQLVDPNLPFRGLVSTQAAMNSIAILKKEAIEDCYTSISHQQLEALSQAILRAQRIVFYASGDSYATAIGFSALIAKIGIDCIPADQYRFNLLSAYHASPKDLALIVSYSGDIVSRIGLQIETLRDRQCPIAIVTANREVAQRFEEDGYPLVVPHRESNYGKVATFYSQTAIRYAFECVYSVVFAQNYAQNMQDKEIIERHNYSSSILDLSL